MYAIIFRPGFRLIQSHQSAISPIIPLDCDGVRAENTMSGIILATNKTQNFKVSVENSTFRRLILSFDILVVDSVANIYRKPEQPGGIYQWR